MLIKLSKFFLYATVFAVLIVSANTLFPFIVGKYVFFRLCIELALIFFAGGIVLDPAAGKYLARLKQLYKNPLVWAVTAFVLAFVVAGFTGWRPAFSFWSNFERGEGGFQMLHLYIYFVLLAVLFREAKDWRKFFMLIMVAALLMAFYGLAAGLKYLDADMTAQGGGQSSLTGHGGFWYNTFSGFVGPQFAGVGQYRFQGTIGNSAYVAAYLLFVFFDIAMLGFLLPGDKHRLWPLGLWAIGVPLAVVFYFCGTRGAFLGLIAGGLVAAAYTGVAHPAWRRRALPAIAAVLLAILLLVFFQNTAFVKHIPGSRIFDISFGAETFSTRTIMWSIAWHAFTDHPLLGVGPENFIWVFDRYFDTHYYDPAAGFGAWFDRAHSIVFDYLAETGILGFLAYLSMFAAGAWLVFRRKLQHIAPEDGWREHIAKGLLLGLPAAYLVQGIVLFDVLTIYLGLFAFFAFLIFLFEPEPQPIAFRPEAPAYTAAVAVAALALFGAYFGALLPYAKASRYIDAEARIGSITSEPQFEDNFNSVLKFYSPVGNEEVPKFLSGDILGALQGLRDDATAHALVSYIEPYLWKTDVRHLLILGQMHGILWANFHHQEDYTAAADYFTAAHQIGPKLPQPMSGLITLYETGGDKARATELIKEMTALWPNATTSGAIK